MGQHHVADIVATARKNNPDHGITGFLVIGADWFAQVLEGPAHEVSALFRRILQDQRHRDVRLVDTRMASARQFGTWSMGTSDRRLTAMALDEILNQSPTVTVRPIDRVLMIANEETRQQAQ
jgi:hypothetical protein